MSPWRKARIERTTVAARRRMLMWRCLDLDWQLWELEVWG